MYVFAGVAGASRSNTEILQTTILHVFQIRGKSRATAFNNFFFMNLSALRAAGSIHYTIHSQKNYPRCARLGVDYKDKKAVRQTTNNSEILNFGLPGN